MLRRSSKRKLRCSSTSVVTGSSTAGASSRGLPSSVSSASASLGARVLLRTLGKDGSGYRATASSDHWPVSRSTTSRGCITSHRDPVSSTVR